MLPCTPLRSVGVREVNPTTVATAVDVNRWMREHEATAPSAYPDVHHLTAKIRAAAREQGDADGFHLWAGQTHQLAQPVPAGELVRGLAADAREAIRSAAERL